MRDNRDPTPVETAELSRRVLIAIWVMAMVPFLGGLPGDSPMPAKAEPARQSAPLPEATVTEVVDGRTVGLSDGTRVQLDGLAHPGECWAQTSTEFAAQTLLGKTVRLARSSDRTGSLLLPDGTDYGVLAVSRGVARSEGLSSDAIKHAQTAARQATLGFWGPSCEGFDVKLAPATATDLGEEPSSTPYVYYKDCAAVLAAGKTGLNSWEPGYRPELDGNADGMACDK